MLRIMLRALLLLFFLAGARTFADDPAIFEFNSRAQEERFQQLTEELRCLVCQNQSLADSHADLAGDMRHVIYRMMVQQSASNEEIIDFLVQRYGEFILFRPPVEPSTYLLWFGPAILFGLGFIVLVITMRRRHQTLTPAISEGEHHRMAELLEEED